MEITVIMDAYRRIRGEGFSKNVDLFCKHTIYLIFILKNHRFLGEVEGVFVLIFLNIRYLMANFA